ncbi:RNase H domain-containing protein [Trichonephila clavipes]|nr:RNase H domain-containing protein [Trichonephila clavipes]
MADILAKEGLDHPVPSTSELTYLELFSRQMAQNKEWLKPPFHKWYKGKRPGLSLSLPCDRQSNTCLFLLASGHLKSHLFCRQ